MMGRALALGLAALTAAVAGPEEGCHPPVIFIKTHKTASSTVAALLKATALAAGWSVFPSVPFFSKSGPPTVPALQSRHDVAPCAGAVRPGLQVVHATAAAAENLPGAHSAD